MLYTYNFLFIILLVPPTGYSPTATTAPGQVAGPMAQAQRKVDPDQMPSPVSSMSIVVLVNNMLYCVTETLNKITS